MGYQNARMNAIGIFIAWSLFFFRGWFFVGSGGVGSRGGGGVGSSRGGGERYVDLYSALLFFP